MKPRYRWNVTVRRFDLYGTRVEQRTPVAVIASDKDEVTTKVRAMFNATYDSFRKFWSHDWVLRDVEEVSS
jgi:hypothetical protein